MTAPQHPAWFSWHALARLVVVTILLGAMLGAGAWRVPAMLWGEGLQFLPG
ncbi:hypothetical protein [Streptosporangium sp. 'caverna']|uniref:hypothetical protein n=1 Tax=Streptosporangium sp. 'caverna' TaxID=2202249 RepID=UPI0013A6F0A3|nr:hypothetical protein [Streptosporangium sp. 'caverna']